MIGRFLILGYFFRFGWSLGGEERKGEVKERGGRSRVLMLKACL